MPETSFFNPQSMALAQEEARVFRETERGKGFLSQVGAGADQLFSFLGNLPNQLAFGDDAEAIRGLSSQLPGFITTELSRKPQTFAETLGQGLGASVVSAPLAAAAAVPFAATAAPLAVNALAGAVGGGIEGAGIPELFGAETALGGAAAGATLGAGFAAVLPIGLRPLTKYIPGINQIFPDATLREAFDSAISTAALGDPARVATQIFPKNDVIDQFLSGSGAMLSDPSIVAGLKGMKLRSLGEALDSQSRGITGDLPFRRLKGDPQFQADAALQKGLKIAGLKNKQVKYLMNSLSRHERSALSMTMDPMAQRLEAGGMPLSEAVSRAAERTPNPAKMAKIQKKLAQYMADDDMLTDVLGMQGIRRATPENSGLAERQVAKIMQDVAEEEPMMGLLLPELFDGATPGQAQRAGRGFLALGQTIKNPIKKGVGSLFGFMKNLRLGAMLTSLSAPMKNISFNGINVGMNVVGRAAGAFGDVLNTKAFGGPQRVYAGEAIAMVKGMFNGLQKDLAHYAAASRHMREAIGNDGIPILNIGSKLLRKQDEWFFEKVFAGEMYAEAYKAGRIGGKSHKAATDGIDAWISKETAEFLQSEGATKAMKRARKAASAKSIEDDVWITREAAKLTRQSGAEPVSLVEARQMAERAIFVAREGRHFDDFLNKLDEWDAALQGGIGAIAPFRRTPANELRESTRALGGDFLGAAMARYNSDIAQGLSEDIAKTRMARDMGKAAVGVSVGSALMYGVKEGLYEIVNDEGKSRAQLDTERAQGVARRSVIINDHIIPLHVMGGVGRALALADTVMRFTGDSPEDEEMRQRGVTELTRQLGTLLEDDFVTDDFIGFFDAMDSAEGLQRYMQRFGASHVPGILRQGGNIVSELVTGESRTITRPSDDPRGGGAAISAGFLNELKRDGDPIIGLFGEKAKETGISKVIGSSRKSTLIAQTAEELQRLGQYKERPSTKVPGVEWKGSDEFDFAQAKGQMQLVAVRRVMDLPQYQELPDNIKTKMVNSAYGRAGRLANRRARNARAIGAPITGRYILSGRIGP
jgi:hypothetical protein